MTPTGDEAEVLRRLAKTINGFLSRPDSGPFQEPVDWRGLELWDYPEIVPNMMDLGTVKRKLDREQYETAYACVSDVRLVWNNCMAYNAEGSDFWLLAKAYSKRFEDRYRKLKAEFKIVEEETEEEDQEVDDDDEDDTDDEEDDAKSNSTPDTKASRSSTSAHHSSLDAKARLAANLLLLNGPEWGHIVTTLELECPSALEVNQLLPEKMEIVLDDMDPNVFAKISTFAAEMAASRKRTSKEIKLIDITGKKKRRK